MIPDELTKSEASARELGRLLRSAAARAAPSRFDESGVVHFTRALERLPLGRPAPRRTQQLILAAVAVLAVLVLPTLWVKRSSTVSYTVDGDAETRGTAGRIAARSSPVRLRFSEGSTVDLDPETLFAIESTASEGATLRLDRGAATANVVHRPDAQWLLLAGPYWIRIVGTSFRTRWAPERSELSVELLVGALEVGGGHLSRGVRMSAEQRFHVLGDLGDWNLQALTPSVASAGPAVGKDESAAARFPPDTPAASAPGSATPTGSAMSTPRPAASGAVPSRSIAAKATETRSNPAVSNGPGLDWPGAVARGQFARVVADAEARGVENCLATTNARELRALADSARYTGKLDLAERALLSLRRRSPNHGALAAYLLGTLNEARGRSATALHWYEEYFRSPGGQELAAEAAAGRIRTLLATRGASAAREAARDYVRDYPRGVGIPTARKILGGE